MKRYWNAWSQAAAAIALCFAVVSLGAPLALAQTAKDTAMKSYAEAVVRGDALASAGEHLDAVREYERARRLVYNNKLVVDNAALEAKIAASRQELKAPRAPSTEIVPAALPPVPRTPGYEEEYAFLPERPGTITPLRLDREGFVVSEIRATGAELAALEANLKRVSEVVLRVPSITPPRGFDIYQRGSLSSPEASEELKAHLAQHLPLNGDLVFSFPTYLEFRKPAKSGGKASSTLKLADPACALRFSFNFLPAPGVKFEDAEGSFLPEPRKDGEVGGQPVHGDMLIVAPPGMPFWVPVTTRRVLAYLLPKYQSLQTMENAGTSSSRKTQEDILRPEAMAKRRAEEAAARAKGGAGAEQNARHLEVMNRRYEEDARKALDKSSGDPRAQEVTQRYEQAKALLASNDTAALRAPACAVIPAHGSTADWKLVPSGTAGCTPIVAPNPRLFNPKLPRSSLQILLVRGISESTKELRASVALRENPGSCVAVTNLIRQLDWKALAALLER